jgi:arsenite methyltransferase
MPATHIQVFDPPMCCSSGVCGPEADPELVRFAADLKWLTERGVNVERFDPTHRHDIFLSTPAVLEEVAKRPNGALPVTLVDGRVTRTGSYPSRSELAAWAGVEEAALGPRTPGHEDTRSPR